MNLDRQLVGSADGVGNGDVRFEVSQFVRPIHGSGGPGGVRHRVVGKIDPVDFHAVVVNHRAVVGTQPQAQPGRWHVKIEGCPVVIRGILVGGIGAEAVGRGDWPAVAKRGLSRGPRAVEIVQFLPRRESQIGAGVAVAPEVAARDEDVCFQPRRDEHDDGIGVVTETGFAGDRPRHGAQRVVGPRSRWRQPSEDGAGRATAWETGDLIRAHRRAGGVVAQHHRERLGELSTIGDIDCDVRHHAGQRLHRSRDGAHGDVMNRHVGQSRSEQFQIEGKVAAVGCVLVHFHRDPIGAHHEIRHGQAVLKVSCLFRAADRRQGVGGVTDGGGWQVGSVSLGSV